MLPRPSGLGFVNKDRAGANASPFFIEANMRNLLRSLLTFAFMAMLIGYSSAQTRTKLCFQTGTSVQSCQDVTTANPLPTTATLSATALSVTVTNTATVPVIVSTPNGFGAGSGFTGNVTVTNTANVSEVNSAAILNAITGAIPAGTNQIGSVTVLNSIAQSLGTTGGWTTKLLNGLTTTVITVKNAAGQLARIYCYNPNSSVAYIQTFNLTPSSVTLGTTTPTNSYGIAATSIGGFGSAIVGDQYSAAISVAATTTVKGLTAPNTALDCNASYN